MLDVCGSVHGRCCAGTGIVAEQPTCYTITECFLHTVAEHAACRLLNAEGRINDEPKHIGNPLSVCHKNNQSKNDVCECHKGNNIGSDRRQAFNSAEDDKSDESD